MISMVFTNNLVIPLHVLYVVILLIAPGWRFVVAVVPRMLLIPTGDGADRPLLPQLGIGDVVWSLSLVVFVHLSELKLEFLVGYLKREATWTRSRTNTLVSLILFQYKRVVTYLGVHDGQSVHPHSPSAVLVLDSMVQKHAKQRVHHVRDLLLFRVLRVNVGHGYQPFLPYRHLQNSSPILSIVVAQQCHIREEQLLHLEQLLRLLWLSN